MSTSASRVIHLDTNVLKGEPVTGSSADRALRRWIRDGEQIAMSAVAWSEFLCGPADAASREAIQSVAARLIGDAIPFDATCAALATDLYNSTGRKRGSHGDCMGAATAIACGASLATENGADFERMREFGLTLRAVTTASK